MVIIPVLVPPVAFADREYETIPFPIPALPAVIVNHQAVLVALQEHSDVVVTVTVPVLSEELKRALVGEMV